MLKFLGILFILTLIVGGLSLYSYSKFESRLIRVESVEPSFKVNLSSILSAGFQILVGDLLGAAEQLIEGAQVDATVEIHNGGLIPIYLPEMDHYILLEGQTSANRPTKTLSMWLMPGGTLVPLSDIPRVALNALNSGNNLEVGVESRFDLAGLTISRRSEMTGKVTQSIEQRVQQERAPRATPTPTPRPITTRTPIPTVTPRIRPLLPTPSPTAIATAMPTPTSRIELVITKVTVLDDHEPFLAGNGEIYFIVGLGNGLNIYWQRLPEFPRHFSVTDGTTLDLNLTSTLGFKPSELDVYIGIWEADDDACFEAWAKQKPSPISGASGELAAAVENLEACDDDLVGASTAQWSEVVQWGKGEHTVTLQDAVIDFTIVPN